MASVLKVDTIKSLTGNEAITISESGVPLLNVPAFRAYVGTLQSVTNAAYSKAQLNAIDFDTNSWFDNTTNYRYTPQIAGYYQLSFSTFVSGTGLTTVQASLWKNNVQNLVGSYTVVSAQTDIFSTGSGLVYLNGTTDYVELFVYAVGSTRNLPVGVSTTFLSGFLVRAS